MSNKNMYLIVGVGIFLFGVVVGAIVLSFALKKNNDISSPPGRTIPGEESFKNRKRSNTDFVPVPSVETVIFDNINKGDMTINPKSIEDVKKMVGSTALGGIGTASFFGFETGQSLPETQKKAQTKLNAALDAVRKLGITNEYIQMRIASMPGYDHPDAKFCIAETGVDCDNSVDWSLATLYYTVTYQVVITVPDAVSMKNVISALTEAGVSHVETTIFSELLKEFEANMILQ